MNTLSSLISDHTEAPNPVISATCPECDMATPIGGEIALGRQLLCDQCGAAIEIVAISPARLDYAFIAPLNHHQSLLSE